MADSRTSPAGFGVAARWRRRGPSSTENGAFDLINEFAAVRLQLDLSANGPQLRITDLVSGHSRVLDPLDVESLIWLSREDFDRFLDPSATRWTESSDAAAGQHPTSDPEKGGPDEEVRSR